MENLKVKVRSQSESREAQELFFELGYGFEGNKIKEVQHTEYGGEFYLFAYGGDFDLTYSYDYELFKSKSHKEITIQQLKDMVVLKRNDVGDATHINFRTNTPYLVQGDKEYYIHKKKWFLSDCPNDLTPIKKPMTETEYLMQGKSGEVLVESVWQLKHSHYKKDVSHLNTLDIYRITELFKPHSCGAHIAKKALCSGERGHKDLLTDIQDIIDTAERWKQMIIEDSNGNP